MRSLQRTTEVTKLSGADTMVLRVKHEVQVARLTAQSLEQQDPPSVDHTQQQHRPAPPSVPTPIHEDLAMIDPELLALSLAARVPAAVPSILVTPSRRNCGMCAPVGQRGVMRICRPCYDAPPALFSMSSSSSSSSSPTSALARAGCFEAVADDRILLTPGVVVVLMVVLFLVAVALVDLADWVRRLRRRRQQQQQQAISLPSDSSAKAGLFVDDPYCYSDGDERLVP
ncbi:hypothetical protein LOY97_006113 [Ophidiomyces ophidiicola]|uniref:uncharacterized protein n=1 Tax=Ophidiomyces ophidiicola TaxID=1387563 RepID=UPI0020C56A37|nr:uncharacterized protein LOZ57_006013 [Ophidiomyces ophidiicola]KAI1940321.1 hypothetical protein LOZ57_006013 [Ophidiomyces ophidiicola]KAI2044594.1 hypothetical protein LOZ43_006328 [Ophidiomyces ophidiicola]KAI2449981.1 Valine--pyruvate aminotransferase [Ophidiomyces ophidiicola]KAI2453567.1 hypothetical protein LOY97_006113 [Ophidiomyces ophidiicola]